MSFSSILRPTQRIDADMEFGPADRLHGDDRTEIASIGADIVINVRGRGLTGAYLGDAEHTAQVVGQQLIGLLFDPRGDARLRSKAILIIAGSSKPHRKEVNPFHDNHVTLSNP
jgi:hypothetical protein